MLAAFYAAPLGTRCWRHALRARSALGLARARVALPCGPGSRLARCPPPPSLRGLEHAFWLCSLWMQAAWSTRVVHARRWEMHGRVRSVAALADESSGTGSRPLHAAATRAKGRANGRAIYSSSSSRAKEKVNETDALFFFLRTALVGRTLVLWPCCPCLPILSYSPRRTREPTRGDRAHLRGDQPKSTHTGGSGPPQRRPTEP